jgi:Domain of unknown function (DUF4214)
MIENNAPADSPQKPFTPSVPVTPFVATLYQDILQRPVDAAGLAVFSAELNQGISPGVVVQQVWTSPEHRQIQIGRYYERFFHRAADVAGSAWWQQQFAQGMNEAQVQEAMIFSPEYGQMHAGTAKFVEGVYGDVLGRLPSASEGVYWVNQLQTGAMSLLTIARDFVQSNEAELSLIDHVYETFLGRAADTGAFASGLGLLAGDQGGQLTLVQEVLTSTEFVKKL